jgi:OOP family OmpA-OmpF porin
MKTTPSLRLACLATLSVCAGASAQAQPDPNYYYLGLGVGQSQSQLDEGATTRSATGSNSGTNLTSQDQQGAPYKVFGGYQFSRMFALEAGYFNLGKFGYTAAAPGGALSGQYQVEGVNIDLLGTAPMSDKWSLIGRVGAQYASTDSSFAGSGALSPLVTSANRSDTNWKLGIGLQYDVSPGLQIRGEAERYRINDGLDNHGDVNMFSLSLVFPLGRASRVRSTPAAYLAPEPVAAAAPAPIAPVAPVASAVAPPPAAVVQPLSAPIAPAKRRVQLSADSHFGFGKPDLSASGKGELDAFVKDARAITFSTVTVEGNTDRLGSEAFNQKLSEDRANAVKSYLEGAPEMAGMAINASGKGKSDPVTMPGDCVGTKATKALVACLAPDRRVDVDVVGVQ